MQYESTFNMPLIKTLPLQKKRVEMQQTNMHFK